jgi:hypothetical protein
MSSDDKEIDDPEFKKIIDEYKKGRIFENSLVIKNIPNIKVKFEYLNNSNDNMNLNICEMEKLIGHKDTIAHNFLVKLLKFDEESKNKGTSKLFEYKIDNKNKTLHLLYCSIHSERIFYFFDITFILLSYTQFEKTLT